MPINITMPALSPTMEEGNLAKWLVKEGDKVSPGDVIAEIETDKATMEVEAVDEGTVAKLVVPAGTEGVKVNALIAVLAEEGEDAAAAAKGGEAPPAKAETKAEPAKAEAPAKTEADAPKSQHPAPKQEKKQAETSGASGGRTFSSPLARRIAKDAGIDISAVSGSGPKGRVVKADVESVLAGGGKAAPASKAADAAAAPAAGAPAPKPMSDDAVLKLFEEGSYELIPHDSMRKTIARRLVEAKSTIPHFYLTLDCEIDALLALRKQLNDAAPTLKGEKGEEPAYKLSVN
ncbi:biotin/lipoyl-binding protein, partial [Mesorhizobium microcysteis]